MYILNITYVLSDSKVSLWKTWLLESVLSKNQSGLNTNVQVYKINHSAEAGQVSFAVQFPFSELGHLDTFEAQLDNEHAVSLAPLFGPQCLYFTTVLSKEDF